MKRKVVYNDCFGGFCLSSEGLKMLYELKNPGKTVYLYARNKFDCNIFDKVQDRTKDETVDDWKTYCVKNDFGPSVNIKENDEFLENIIYEYDLISERHDPDLVTVVETLGTKRASGTCSKLKVIDIGDSKYHIDEYDGNESVITQLDNNFWK